MKCLTKGCKNTSLLMTVELCYPCSQIVEKGNDFKPDWDTVKPFLDRIAELDKGCAGLTIEEQEQNMLNSKAKWYQEGVESERAACIKLIEEKAGLPDLSAHSKFDMYIKIFMQKIVDQIKERSN